MDLRHLRTFVAVAELGTVSKAALHLRTAQPALSRQISDLEHELGLTLFDRVGRRLCLTGAGEQLLGNCRSLLGAANALGEQAQLLRHGNTGVLRVAASPVQIETIFSTFLQSYAARYPGVQVKLIEAIGAATPAMVDRGEIHLGVSLLQSIQVENHHLGIYPVPPVQILAACHPSFPLPKTDAVDIGLVTQHPLLLLNAGFVARKSFDRVCRLERLKQNVLFESQAPHNLLAFAEAGLGVAVIPSVVQTHRYHLRLARIVHDGQPLREPLAVIWDKRRDLPPYARDFCETLASHILELTSVKRGPVRKGDRLENHQGATRNTTVKRRKLRR